MTSRYLLKLFTIFIITLTILLTSCTKTQDNIKGYNNVLVLGAILPLDQDKGVLRANALQLAIDQINLAGGVGDGYFINLIIVSSEGTDRKVAAAAMAKQIINHNENVVGFISSFSSSTSGIVEDVCIPDHYPCISCSATANTLTGISQYFHRLCPSDDFEANVLSDKAKALGINSVAIAVEDGDNYSTDLADAFETAFGTGVTEKIKFVISDIDYLNKINQLLAANPEGLFISMLNPNAYIKFFDNLSQINTTFILPDALYSNDLFQADIVQILGDINGHTKNFGAFPSADKTTEAYQYFEDELMKAYNQAVASYNAQFYDAGYIYAMAMEKAMMDVSPSNIAAFREKVNDYIRVVSKGTAGDTIVTPDQGWEDIKEACIAGGVDYSGSSGNCDIDHLGNAVTAYSIFKVIKPGNDYQFEIIEVIP